MFVLVYEAMRVLFVAANPIAYFGQMFLHAFFKFVELSFCTRKNQGIVVVQFFFEFQHTLMVVFPVYCK